MAFVSSNCNKQKLTENGYVHVVNKKSADGDRTFWNNEKRKSDGCRAIVHTQSGNPSVIKRINDHNYSGNVKWSTS